MDYSRMKYWNRGGGERERERKKRERREREKRRWAEYVREVEHINMYV